MNIWYHLKEKRVSDIVLNLNLVSFFTEMSSIQNKAKKIVSKKDPMKQFFDEFQITWPKIDEEIYQTLWFKWVFELWEFEL